MKYFSTQLVTSLWAPLVGVQGQAARLLLGVGAGTERGWKVLFKGSKLYTAGGLESHVAKP